MKAFKGTIRKTNIIDFLLYFFCFFPFIQLPLFNMSTDIQPYALIVAMLYFGKIYNKKIPVPICVLGIFSILIFNMSLFLNSGNAFYVFRSFCNYIEVLLISLAARECFKNNNGINERIIKLFIIVWFIIALIQMFINHSFMTSFVSNFRTSENRGVCCMNSEPSFYGYICYFTLILAQKFNSRKFFYSFLLVIQIIFCAQSTVSIVYLLITLLFLQLYNLYKFHDLKTISMVFLAIIVVIVSFYAVITYFADSRMSFLLQNSINNPIPILSNDVSINERIMSITLSLQYFFSDFGFPHGFILFKEYNHARIMSGFGALLYEMGIVGLLYIIYLFKTFKSSFNIAYAFSVTIIMFSTIQLGLPLFGFLAGYAMYESELCNYNNEVVKK